MGIRWYSTPAEQAAYDLCKEKLHAYSSDRSKSERAEARKGKGIATKVVLGRFAGKTGRGGIRRGGNWEAQSNQLAHMDSPSWVARSKLLLNKASRIDVSHGRITQKVAGEYKAYMEESERKLPRKEALVQRCRQVLAQRLRAYYSQLPANTYVPRTETTIVAEIFSRDVYRFLPDCCLPKERCLLMPGDTVLDIGAHVGLASLAASSVAKTVVAVEPHPRCFSILQRNLAGRDSSTEYVLEQKAVSREPGKVKLWLHKGKGSGRSRLFFSSLYKKRPMRSKPVLVDGQPLQWFISRYEPDVVKLDGEGCEIELGNCKVWGRVRTIVAEWDWKYHGLCTWARTRKALERSGFHIKHANIPKSLPIPGKNSGMIFVATRQL